MALGHRLVGGAALGGLGAGDGLDRGDHRPLVARGLQLHALLGVAAAVGVGALGLRHARALVVALQRPVLGFLPLAPPLRHALRLVPVVEVTGLLERLAAVAVGLRVEAGGRGLGHGHLAAVVEVDLLPSGLLAQLVGREAAALAVALADVGGARLGQKAVGVAAALRHEHVDVGVAAVDVVDGPVHDHAAGREAVGVVADELYLLGAAQAARQGRLDLAGGLGARAALGSLDLVPERRAVAPAVGRALRQLDAGGHDAALSAEVVDELLALVDEPGAAAVGRGGNGGAPGGAADGLDRAVVYGHGRLLPSGRRNGSSACLRGARGESPAQRKPLSRFPRSRQGEAAQLP